MLPLVILDVGFPSQPWFLVGLPARPRGGSITDFFLSNASSGKKTCITDFFGSKSGARVAPPKPSGQPVSAAGGRENRKKPAMLRRWVYLAFEPLNCLAIIPAASVPPQGISLKIP